MKAVTTRRETENCQQRLEDALARGLNRKSEITIKYRGGSANVTANHNERIWFYSEKEEEKSRFWNPCGYLEKSPNNIVVEINPPLDAVYHRLGGMFAFGQDDSLFLLHTGKISGPKGIGPILFRKWYSRFTPLVDVEIAERKTMKVILVGNISDEQSLVDDLEVFIRNVWVFKQVATNQGIDNKSAVLLSSLQTTKKKAGRPGKRTTSVSTYNRDRRITELVKLGAKGKCDLCKKKGPFPDVFGFPFLEVHHVEWLSEGGEDQIANTVALCPNCHRKMHHVNDGDDKVKLREIAKKREKRLLGT